MSTRDDLTAAAHEVWESTAEGWLGNADLIDRWSVPVQGWLLARLEPSPGDTILELAAGAGDTGFAAAQRIGPQGRLVSSDISRSMVEGAERRAAALGLTNVEFRTMDAQEMDLDDGSFDGVIHRFGPMLLPDPAASMRESCRVLREGGRYVAATWAGPEDNPWILIQGLALMQQGIELEGDIFGPGGMFSLSTPDALGEVATHAGFDPVEADEVEQRIGFAGFDELWLLPSQISGPIAQVLRGAEAEKVAAIKEGFRELADQYRTDSGYEFPAKAVCVLGRRP